MECLPFWEWLYLLNAIILSCIYFSAKGRLSFFYMVEKLMHCEYKACFLYTILVSWTLVWFHNISQGKQWYSQHLWNAEMLVLLWVNTQEWFNGVIFRYLKNPQMGFHSDYTSLHSYQWCVQCSLSSSTEHLFSWWLLFCVGLYGISM